MVRHPRRASSSTVARPMPELAPVTSTVCRRRSLKSAPPPGAASGEGACARSARSCRARRRAAVFSCPSSYPKGRRGLQLQGLDSQELLDRELAQLAAVTRLLEAAEGRQRIEGAAVDLDLAAADTPGDALGALGIARPHSGGEAVDGVVGDAHGVVLVVVGH